MQAKILFLESFYGGSHRDFADGLSENTRHSVDFVTLPAARWKWRIRGAALTFFEKAPDPRAYDLIFVTDMISLADLKALWPPPTPPIILYMHENQISYPVPPGTRLDYHFGISNITSALAADRIIFNSNFHMCTFLDALPAFLCLFPEYRPMWVIEEIKKKSSVLYPGCRFISAPVSTHRRGSGPKKVVWNHRWEFEKKPDLFFSVLDEVDDAGIDFELIIMGENFQKVPGVFASASERYGERLLNYGYVESRKEYYRWLGEGDVVISTAIEENFGISMIEAMRMGCFPLLPERLAYPEVLPKEFHDECLYSTKEDLVSRLKKNLTNPRTELSGKIPAAMDRYAWKNVIEEYDSLFDSAIEKR